MTNSKLIYFNSADRDMGGTPESFTLTKDVQLGLAPRRVKLIQATIQDSWNNVTSENNRVDLVEQVGPVTYNISIPPGRYTGTNLAAAIKTQFDTASGNVYTVSYNGVTGRFTISMAANFQLDFQVSNSLALVIGFMDNTITPVALSHTSPNVAALQPGNEIFVTSNLVLGVDNGVMIWSSSAPMGILAVIPLTIQNGKIDYQAPEDLTPLIMSQSDFAQAASKGLPLSFTLSLTFSSGLSVELNGTEWSGILRLDF